MSTIRTLLWKEMRQMPRKRSALLSAVLFPIIFFIILPGVNFIGLTSGSVSGTPAGVDLAPGLGRMPADYVMRGFMLPLVAVLGGLIIPTIAATYTIIAERERHTIELLVALPVSLGQIVFAKLLAVCLLGLVISVPLFGLDVVLMIVLQMGSLADAAILFFLLLATLLYSTASALLVSLIAADFRTANNLTGAMIGPIILITMVVLILLPGGMLRLIGLGLVFLVIGLAAIFISARALTIERFLR